MRKNVGTIDATIRITLGLIGLAYGIGKMSRRGRTPWMLLGLSAMKVAEGVTRYCPTLNMIGINTRDDSKLVSDEQRSSLETGKATFTESMIAKTVEKMIGTEPAKNTEPAKSEQSLSSSDQQLENQLKEYLAGQGVATATPNESPRPSDAYQADEHMHPNYS